MGWQYEELRPHVAVVEFINPISVQAHEGTFIVIYSFEINSSLHQLLLLDILELFVGIYIISLL